MDSNFKNLYEETTEKNNSHKFKNKVVIPFISGALGCSLVMGICLGVPEVKSKILGNTGAVSSSSYTTLLNDSNAGSVDFVSLSSYSDTAVYAANKILPSIVGIEISYNVTQNSMFSMFGFSD